MCIRVSDKRYRAIWKMYGLDLPGPILGKLYWKNAVRLIAGLETDMWE